MKLVVGVGCGDLLDLGEDLDHLAASGALSLTDPKVIDPARQPAR